MPHRRSSHYGRLSRKITTGCTSLETTHRGHWSMNPTLRRPIWLSLPCSVRGTMVWPAAPPTARGGGLTVREQWCQHEEFGAKHLPPAGKDPVSVERSRRFHISRQMNAGQPRSTRDGTASPPPAPPSPPGQGRCFGRQAGSPTPGRRPLISSSSIFPAIK